jgi:hypothetical protein
MKELRKYLVRFGLVLLLAIPVMIFTQGADAARLIGYKVCLIAIGVGLAELLWAFFFKPQYGKTEGKTSEELFPILVFRGFLYSSIVLALSLGL